MKIATDSKTCGAARPTPLASRSVTSMSATSAWIASEAGKVTDATGARNTGCPSWEICLSSGMGRRVLASVLQHEPITLKSVEHAKTIVPVNSFAAGGSPAASGASCPGG